MSSDDVSLREHVTAKIDALDRHLTSELASASRAVELAALEAAERLKAHNGLIEQMRQQAQTFATRESIEDQKETVNRRLGRIERFQSMLTGGLILLSFIGIANLTKLWFG